MAESGPNQGGTATDGGIFSPWGEGSLSNVGDSVVDNDTPSTADLTINSESRFIDIVNFGSFAGVSAGAVVTNVLVELKCRCTSDDARFSCVDLIVGGTPLGTQIAGNTNITTANGYRVAASGGPVNYFGKSGDLTGAEANASNFGVRIAVGSDYSTSVEIDAVRITLTYEVSSTYTLTAENGSFTATCNAANLVLSRKLTTQGGTFSQTGSSANLIASRVLATAAGSLIETGQSAGMFVSRLLSVAAGSFVETGNAVTLTYSAITGEDSDANAEIASGVSVGVGIGL